RERIAARGIRFQLFGRQIADTEKSLRKRGGMLINQIDRRDLLAQVYGRYAEVPYAGARGGGFRIVAGERSAGGRRGRLRCRASRSLAQGRQCRSNGIDMGFKRVD